MIDNNVNNPNSLHKVYWGSWSFQSNYCINKVSLNDFTLFSLFYIQPCSLLTFQFHHLFDYFIHIKPVAGLMEVCISETILQIAEMEFGPPSATNTSKVQDWKQIRWYLIKLKDDFLQSSINTYIVGTVMILSFRTDRPGQTVQTQIRLLLEEQSDQGLHCLLFRLHCLDLLLYGRAT